MADVFDFKSRTKVSEGPTEAPMTSVAVIYQQGPGLGSALNLGTLETLSIPDVVNALGLLSHLHYQMQSYVDDRLHRDQEEPPKAP